MKIVALMGQLHLRRVVLSVARPVVSSKILLFALQFRNFSHSFAICDENSAKNGVFRESTTTDECRSCYDATTSSVGEERRFDEELDKHMMQTIADVKYVKKRPKFVAVGKFSIKS